jgi:transcriptional regulator GlxA family with amidase domain
MTCHRLPCRLSIFLKHSHNTWVPIFSIIINKARIDDAKRLLTETERSVLDVAVSTGFNARSSFYKAFKQFADVTPSKYRRLHGYSSD